MTRDDLKKYRALDIDFSAIGLEYAGEERDAAYFCTPIDAEHIGWIGCDGIHFILLPGDERVFCVDPAMGEEGTYVLPVAEDFREFLAFVLYCRDANPLSQIWWLEEARFRRLLQEDTDAYWDGCEEFFARKAAVLETIARRFGLTPKDPYEKVKSLQVDFDPACLNFSDEYYDILGLVNPRKRVEIIEQNACAAAETQAFDFRKEDNA